MANEVNWRSVNADMGNKMEDELLTMINYEVSTDNRKSIVVRLHQRYSKLRTLRERNQLIEGKLL